MQLRWLFVACVIGAVGVARASHEEILVPPMPGDDANEWTPALVSLRDPLSWPRASQRQLGCLLEKHGAAPGKFGCAAPKPPAGDPCKGGAYNDGPAVPRALVASVDARLESVELSWEHGSLQAVVLAWAPGVTKAELESMFPVDRIKGSHKNVMSVSIQACARASYCVVLQGFDHLGAGDVECPAR